MVANKMQNIGESAELHKVWQITAYTIHETHITALATFHFVFVFEMAQPNEPTTTTRARKKGNDRTAQIDLTKTIEQKRPNRAWYANWINV